MAGAVGVGGGGFTVVDGARVGFVDEVTPFLATGDHTVDGAPVGEATDVAVVDEEVCLQLAGEVRVVVGGFLGVVAVGGVEFHAALTTPLEGLVKELALATAPEDQAMTISNEHLKGLNGEGALLTNLGVFVLDNRSVEINCNYHEFFSLQFIVYSLWFTVYSLEFIV